MTVVPRFPPLAGEQPRSEALWNAAVSYAGHQIPLASAGAAATFSLSEIPDAAAPCLVVESGTGPTLYIYVSAFPFPAMFGADLAAEDLLHLPPPLRDALAEGITSLIWNAVPGQALGGRALKAIGRRDQVAGDDQGFRLAWFGVTLTGLAAEPIVLSLGCARSELLDWLENNGVASRRVHDALKSQLQTSAAFTLGSVPFTLREVRSLSEGALVLLPQIEPMGCAVRAGETIYEFRLAEGGWMLAASRNGAGRDERSNAERRDSSMDGEAAGAAQGAPKLADLQVVIDFDLGATSVPLADIESWQAGAVVALDAPPRAEGVEVTLRVAGKAIGIGELVRIDDRYAVRLSRVLFAS